MLYDGTATKSIDLSLTDTVIGSNKLWPTDENHYHGMICPS